MSLSLLKTGAVAAAILLATTASSFAASWAYVDHDAYVRASHFNVSPVVNAVEEGQYVKVINSWGNWYKVQIPGQDGWVKASVLDFTPGPGPGPGPGNVQFCFWGPLGYVCVNN